MYVLIRRAGFWNAKSYALSSQFGHIMLGMDGVLYSFNQSVFLEGGDGSCVQRITPEAFEKTYAGQRWHVVALTEAEVRPELAVEYFLGPAQEHEYSLKNNCTRECQKALEAAGVTLGRERIFPGSVLCALLSAQHKEKVRAVRQITVGVDTLLSA